MNSQVVGTKFRSAPRESPLLPCRVENDVLRFFFSMCAGLLPKHIKVWVVPLIMPNPEIEIPRSFKFLIYSIVLSPRGCWKEFLYLKLAV